MITFIRSLLLLCCCVLPLTSICAQDVKVSDKPARSVVHGRVIFADSEQPLRRANVRLRKEYNREVLKRTVSGKRGEFSFQGVAPGTYYIDVEAPGVMSLTNGFSFTDLGYGVDDSGLALVTVDGDNDVKTEIRAVRGAVISGRISYGDGEPATHAQLVLYRQKDQTPVLFVLDRLPFTDDRGVYRIEGLPAGKYVVGAIENNSGGGRRPLDSPGLVTAFHPAAFNVSAATVVSVQTGSEARDVNISFGDDPRQLSGVLKWKQTNAAIKNGVVFLRRVGDPQVDVDYLRFVNAVTKPSDANNDGLMFRDMYFLSLLTTNAPYVESNETGRWTFPDVTPGTYVVSVEAPVPVEKPVQATISDDTVSVPDFSKGVLRGKAEVKIGDKDVDNVVIELTSGATITGSIVIDGNPAPKNSVFVRVVTAGLSSLLFVHTGAKDDGSFVLSSVPTGQVRLDIYEQHGRSNYYLRSMTTAKGLDLRNEPLTVTEGEQITGVQIALGTDLATVEGRVVPASGDGSVAGAGVLLLPADQQKWNTRSLWGLTRADSEGKFSLRLAPGEYIATAWSLQNEPTEPLESYVRTRLLSMQRIIISPNETKSIEVQAATSREP